jgi:hypothetical protein
MTGYKRYHSHSGTCQLLHDVTPEQFEQLLDLIPEPNASMVFVAVWTGLRVRELIGLKWDDAGKDSLTVDEGCCRGDWDAPKSGAGNVNRRHCIGVMYIYVNILDEIYFWEIQVFMNRGIQGTDHLWIRIDEGDARPDKVCSR